MKIKAAEFHIHSLADTFLCTALVFVKSYKCAKFQLPSFISYGDMERSQNLKKMRAADLPRHPLANKFFNGAIVLACAYQRTEFQLFSLISLDT